MSNNFIVGTYNKKKMRAVEIVFRGNVFFFNYLLLKFRLNAEKAEKKYVTNLLYNYYCICVQQQPVLFDSWSFNLTGSTSFTLAESC